MITATLPGGKPHYEHPDTNENIRLAGGQANIRYTIVDSTHQLVDGKLTRPKLTDAHTILDAEFSWRPDWGGAGTLVFLRATNLLDQDARVHSSPLKDEVPLPGRSLAAGLRFTFGD